MNKRDIKVLLTSYYLKSLCSYNDDFYPIMAVEAVKSIIGINLDKSSNKTGMRAAFKMKTEPLLCRGRPMARYLIIVFRQKSEYMR